MLRRFSVLCLLALVVLLIFSQGCSSMKIEDFAGKEPRFVLEEYFAGRTRAWGLVHDRFGRLKREFTVDIVGEQVGEELVLTEDFLYSDGEKEQRIWRIKKLDEHRYEGRAGDVLGVAQGEAYGNALHWEYDLNLKMKDEQRIKVHFDDWMYLQPNQILANRAKMSKFGVELAEVMLFFSKSEVQGAQ